MKLTNIGRSMYEMETKLYLSTSLNDTIMLEEHVDLFDLVETFESRQPQDDGQKQTRKTMLVLVIEELELIRDRTYLDFCSAARSDQIEKRLLPRTSTGASRPWGRVDAASVVAENQAWQKRSLCAWIVG